ncbi:MAG: type II secretion system protein F, partial [Schaalia georgiae]|nr:type II secretion system protein F [Schaalia georgiae]
VSARLLARLRSRDGAVDEAVACDLVLAGLRCGASIPQVLAALGGAVGSDGLVRISRELRLGVGWAAAWDPTPPGTELLREGLEAAWLQGVSPEAQLRRAAAQTRRHRIADAKKAAEELGISLVAPLGALLLPAFVLLGLVPIVIHMFAGILGSV